VSKKMAVLVATALMVLATLSAQAQSEPLHDVKMAPDEPYLDDGDPRHRLDFYAPSDIEEPFPVILFVSGGGWSQGSKLWIANLGGIFAGEGIGFVAIDHRLVPDVTPAEQVEDLAAAFAWLADRWEQIGADPSRVFVGGHSAGGHLMSLLAMDEHYLEAVGHSPDEIAGVILVSGALDVENQFGAELAPLNYVHEELPDFLIFYAAGDSDNIIQAAETLQAELAVAQVPVEVVEVPQTDHFSIIASMRMIDGVTEWINGFSTEGG
jgi:acetyl esterase/lipase